MAFFSVDRIKSELDYMVDRMKGHEDVPLSICDSNFGSYPHDEEIAEHIATLMHERNWPKAFDVNTGKTDYDRILRISDRLDGRMSVSTSLQSKNQKTLRIIRRKNLSENDFRRISAATRAHGGVTNTEFILPMPAETKASFMDGLRYAIDAGTDNIQPYTTMMLPQTPLVSKAFRQLYSLQTRFRVIPHSFGEYEGQRCVEYEEVCVATSTLSFQEYLECRGMGLMLKLLSGPSFDVVRRLCAEWGVDYLDVLEASQKAITCSSTPIAKHYEDFIRETEGNFFLARSISESFSVNRTTTHVLSLATWATIFFANTLSECYLTFQR
ncbi:MAG: hypothetical protein A2051_10295 [Desulfovibrionales bacterium GWA2_65_9]|nr:MAG: hypothetical protein A2051_10295 [Desulfovibrionales bacterium GWA2_65_9]